MKHVACVSGLLAMLAGAVNLPAAETAAKPNILWLIAEDFGPHLGCYGTKEVFTPNLDAMAAAGMRFTRFYTTAPVCSPSRSAFMTGMYATAIGAHDHRSHRGDGFKLPDGVNILPDWFRAAGYFTANIAKFPAEDGIKGTGKTDWNFEHAGKPFDSNAWANLKTNQPFYAQVNFSETHRTFHGPKRADPAKVDLPPYYPDVPAAREDWAKYLDDATELDRKVGIILKRLETDGLADNTIVCFFGDNGQAHVRGKQFCYESGLWVPLIIRWPKGVPAAKGFAAGTVSAQLLCSLDLSATSLSLAGVAKPEKMQGRVFLGDSAGPPREFVFGARDRCDETELTYRTVRDARYRYIRCYTPDKPLLLENEYKAKQYPVWNLMKQLHAEGKLNAVQDRLCQPTQPREELYDLQEDPHEIRNLADSPGHKAVLERLSAALDGWIAECKDAGLAALASGTKTTTPEPKAPGRRKNK